MFHRLCTTQPIGSNDIADLAGKLYVVEGDHYDDLTI